MQAVRTIAQLDSQESAQANLNGPESNSIFDNLDLVMNFTIGGTYDDVNGKFGKIYGNVAILDCHYIHESLFDAI